MIKTVDSIYNPSQLTKEELIDRFVVRQQLFEKLYRHISEAKMEVPEEHLLIVGQRGMGKTTLLLRLAYEVEDDEKLNNWLIPITFNEEQYNIRKLYNLWEETARNLADKDAGFMGLFDEMDALYTNSAEEERYEKLIFDLMIEKLRSQKKKIVLFIDNFNVLLKKIDKQESQRLRKILSTCPDIRIVAASPIVISEIYDYKHPLMEQLKTFYLKGLDEESTFRLLRKLGESYKQEEVEDLLENYQGRVETLRRITGGIIRTNVLLFEIFVDERKGNVFQDLERLLDRVTPLYKDRTDDLPKNQQVIIDAIALHWDAASTKDIRERTRLESKVISAQLGQLAKNDWIEVIPTSTKNHLYRLKERFYNIWYLMRNGRKQDSQRVVWLVKFLDDWLGPNGLKSRLEKLKDCFSSGEYDEKGAFYMTEALIRTSHITLNQEQELLNAAKVFLEGKNSALAGRLSKSDFELSEEIGRYIANNNYKMALQLLQNIKRKTRVIRCSFGMCYMNMESYEEAEKYHLNAVGNGYRSFEDEVIQHYYKDWFEEMKVEEKRTVLNEIRRIYLESLNCLAHIYHYELIDFQKAEKYYKKAIEIKDDDLESLTGLGALYRGQNRYEEAEKIKEEMLYSEEFVNNEKMFYSFILAFITIDELAFLYDYFESEFSKKHRLKDNYKTLWYAVIYFLKGKNSDEYLRSGPELQQTLDETIKTIKELKSSKAFTKIAAEPNESKNYGK